MIRLISPISSLLLGIALLLVGGGGLGTVLAIRAQLEGYSTGLVGVLMSAYFAGFLLGTWQIPALIGRVGHVRAFTALAAGASLAASAHGLWVDPWFWGLLRGTSGFCVAGIYLAIESWLNSQTPTADRGRVLAVYTLVTLGANATGQYLLLAGDPSTSRVFTLISILLSCGLIPVALTRVPEPGAVPHPHLDLREMFAVSPIAVAGGLASGLANGSLWGLGALFARDAGFSEAGVATFMSLVIAGGAVLQWPVGHASDRHDRRKVLISVCFAGALVASLVALAAGRPAALPAGVLLAGAFLYGGAAFTIYPLSLAQAIDHVSPARALSVTRGILMLYGLGAIAGPLAAGPLMSRLGSAVLFGWFAAVLTLVALFGLYRMTRRPALPDEEHVPFIPVAGTSQAALEMYPEAEDAEHRAASPALGSPRAPSTSPSNLERDLI